MKEYISAEAVKAIKQAAESTIPVVIPKPVEYILPYQGIPKGALIDETSGNECRKPL